MVGAGRAGCRVLTSGWGPQLSETRPAGRANDAVTQEMQSADPSRDGTGQRLPGKVHCLQSQAFGT